MRLATVGHALNNIHAVHAVFFLLQIQLLGLTSWQVTSVMKYLSLFLC